MKIKATVIGKWEKGVIFKRPMLSLKLENMKPEYYDLPTSKAFWFACEIGSHITLEMEQDKTDNLWYPV